MAIEEVKQIIANSKFNPDLKNRLVLLLSRLGKYTVSGLGKEVSRGDSLIIADYLVSLWENLANLLDGLKNSNGNSVENLLKLLVNSKAKSNGEDELYVLNLALDVRALAYSRRVLTSEQYQQLLDYEIWLFWQLPKDEVLSLLQNHILYLAQKLNLSLDTQAAVYTNDWDYAVGFPQIFSTALLQNKEILGKVPTMTVGFWIQKCVNFSTNSRHQMTTFEVANFLFKEPLVQKLTQPEKKILSEILNLYAWFLNPIIDVDRIVEYKSKKIANEADEAGQQQYFNKQKFELAKNVLQTNQVKQPSIPPVPPRPPKPASISAEPAKAAPSAAQASSGENLGNQKPRFDRGSLAGSNREREPDLSSMGMIAQDKAFVEEPREAANVQDVLGQRQRFPQADKSSQVESSEFKEQKAAPPAPGLSFAKPGLGDAVDIKALEEAARKKRAEEEAKVNQKLEELKKRLGQQ